MTEYFNDEKNVQAYIKMCVGFDGEELIKIFKEYVPLKSKILEIGIGPGHDLDILKKDYNILGTDYSQIFLNIYSKKDSKIKLERVDARNMKMEKDLKFQGIYSNKSLIYFSKEELKKSFQLQSQKLLKDGILFHSFWFGDSFEEFSQSYYYNFDSIKECIPDNLKIEKMEKYTEMEKDDSFYLILNFK
eukprot:gene11653-4892_t